MSSNSTQAILTRPAAAAIDPSGVEYYFTCTATTLKYYAAVSKKGMIEAIEKMSDYTKTGVA